MASATKPSIESLNSALRAFFAAFPSDKLINAPPAVLASDTDPKTLAAALIKFELSCVRGSSLSLQFMSGRRSWNTFTSNASTIHLVASALLAIQANVFEVDLSDAFKKQLPSWRESLNALGGRADAVSLVAREVPVAELWSLFSAFHKSFNPGVVRMIEPIKAATSVNECAAALIRYETYVVSSGAVGEKWLPLRAAWRKRMELTPHSAYQVASGLRTLNFYVPAAFQNAEWTSTVSKKWQSDLVSKADADSAWTLNSKAASNTWPECWELVTRLLSTLKPDAIPAAKVSTAIPASDWNAFCGRLAELEDALFTGGKLVAASWTPFRAAWRARCNKPGDRTGKLFAELQYKLMQSIDPAALVSVEAKDAWMLSAREFGAQLAPLYQFARDNPLLVRLQAGTPALTALASSDNSNLTAVDQAALIPLLLKASLTNVHITSQCQFSEAGILSLLQAWQAPSSKLQTLRVGSVFPGEPAPFSEAAYTAIWRMLKDNKTITSVTIRPKAEITLNTAFASAISVLSSNRTLKIVEMPGWRLSSNAVKSICDAVLPQSSLVNLNLSDNILDLTAVQHVADLFAQSKTLTNLNLSRCQLNDAACAPLTAALKTNLTCRRLWLNGNQITAAGAQQLKEATAVNFSVIVISLENNPAASAVELKDFIQTFTHNKPPAGRIALDDFYTYDGAVNADGKPHGNGIKFFKNGEIHSGPHFENGLLSHPTDAFLNFLVTGKRGCYEGGVAAGKLHGKGRYVKMPTSAGRFESCDLDCVFENGQLHGLAVGTFYLSDGTGSHHFEGEYVSGARTLGVEWDTRGNIHQCGRWGREAESQRWILTEERPVPVAKLRDGRYVPLAARSAGATLLYPCGSFYIGPIDSDHLPVTEGQGKFFDVQGNELKEKPVCRPSSIASSTSTSSSTASSSSSSAPPALTDSPTTPSDNPSATPTAAGSSTAAQVAPLPSGCLTASSMDAWFERRFASIVGQESLKQQMRDFYAEQLWHKQLRDEGRKVDATDHHMLFVGPPGTGKTTMAEVVSELLAVLEVATGDLVTVESGSALIGKFVGHTAPLVDAKVKEAKDGVLFIDEAYLMSQNDKFGPEAVGAVMKHMDPPSCVFIFAGYSEQMDEFLAVNAGMARRMTFRFEFNPYSRQELYEILCLKLQSQDLHLTASPSEVGALLNRVPDMTLASLNGGFIKKWVGATGRAKARSMQSPSNAASSGPASPAHHLDVGHLSAGLELLRDTQGITLLDTPTPISESNPELQPSRYTWVPPPPKHEHKRSMLDVLRNEAANILESDDKKKAIMHRAQQLLADKLRGK